MKSLSRGFIFLLTIASLFVLIPHVKAATTYDMADPSNWNIRFDSPQTNSYLSTGTIQTADLYGTGHQDILISTPCSSNSGLTTNGSVYIISYSVYSRFTGKGNVVDLADPNNYTLRIDGANSAAQCKLSFAAFGALKTFDITGDHRPDLFIDDAMADLNGRTGSGGVYIIYNDIIRENTRNATGNVMFLGHQDGEGKFDQFNIRIDGPAVTSPVQGYAIAANLGRYIGIGNVTGSGTDLVLATRSTGFNGYYGGSTYLIAGTILNNLEGRGNTLDLSNSTSYTIRVDGPHVKYGIMGAYLANTIADFDSDGKDDLIIGVANTATTISNSYNLLGGIYILYNSLLSTVATGTGHVLDLNDSTSYNILLTADQRGDFFGYYGPYTVTDFEKNGDKWLFAGALRSSHQGRTRNGALFIFKYSLLSKYTGTGNTVSLTDTSNYYARLDGAANEYWLSDMFTAVQDYFGTGSFDLLTGGPKTPSPVNGTEGPSDWGWVYVIPHLLLTSQSNASGNIIDMANTSNYSILFQGAPMISTPASGTHLCAPMTDLPIDVDLNGDGTHDSLFVAHRADFTNGANSGTLYVRYNFPHTITASRKGSKITGTISFSNSTTSVVKVQYSVDNKNPAALTWKDCTGTTTYSCTVPTFTSGTHTIYLRVQDSDGVYTAATRYKSVKIAIQSTISSSYLTQVSVSITPTPTTTDTPIVTSIAPSPSSTALVTPTAKNNQTKSQRVSIWSFICGTLGLIIVLFLLLLFLRKRKEKATESD